MTESLSEIDIRIIRGIHAYGTDVQCVNIVSDAVGVTKNGYYSRVDRLGREGYLAKRGSGTGMVRYITPQSLPFVVDSELPRIRAEHELLRPHLLHLLSGLHQNYTPKYLRKALRVKPYQYNGYLDGSYALNRNGKRLLDESGFVYEFLTEAEPSVKPSQASPPSPVILHEPVCPDDITSDLTEDELPRDLPSFNGATLPSTFQITHPPSRDNLTLVWRGLMQISVPSEPQAILLANQLEQLPRPRSRDPRGLRNEFRRWRACVQRLVGAFEGVICYRSLN